MAGPRGRPSHQRAAGRTARAGTGARTRTATPTGVPAAARCRSGPAPARLARRPSAGRATITEAPVIPGRGHRHRPDPARSANMGNGERGQTMDDKQLSSRIGELIAEEHALERQDGEPDQQRLKALEVELDQCWDLLRQRRPRRSAGEDPDDAEARPGNVVEGYLQ